MRIVPTDARARFLVFVASKDGTFGAFRRRSNRTSAGLAVAGTQPFGQQQFGVVWWKSVLLDTRA